MARLDQKDTTVDVRSPSARRLVAIVALLATARCGGCAGGAGAPSDAAPTPSVESSALAWLDAASPARADLLAHGHELEAAALKAPSPVAATRDHVLAARLFERAFRTSHEGDDARLAVRAYAAAAADTSIDGACDAAIEGARLEGDLARDAESAWLSLHKAARRIELRDAGADACGARIEAELRALEAFKPPARVVRAVDDGLAAEGALGAAAMMDAGAVVREGPPKLDRIESWSGRDAARVVLTLSSRASFRAGDDPAPPPESTARRALRTFVDLDGVTLAVPPELRRGQGLLSSLRIEPTTTGTRVSLVLDGAEAYRKVFFLMEPYRVVIDVARRAPGVGARRNVTSVVLDPGHGGNDAGATGPSSVKEKDVTLAIAKRARAALVKDGLEVTLTRDDDRYVTLEERTARANQSGADLFVSIHCNAAENHARHGVETYVLDTTKDAIASRVAARENATSEGASAELGTILADMRLAEQATRSTKLAALLQKSAMSSLRGAYDGVTDGGLHYAGFYVLVGARMPAVLFETSYVSNPTEEARLSSDDYQGRLADAIANAVKAYRQGR